MSDTQMVTTPLLSIVNQTWICRVDPTMAPLSSRPLSVTVWVTLVCRHLPSSISNTLSALPPFTYCILAIQNVLPISRQTDSASQQ